jgi:hypothetical protein
MMAKMIQKQEEQITKLIALMATKNTPNQRNLTDDTKRRFKENGNYCWTHGHDISKPHTSETCNRPRAGHKKEATKANTMGGSNANKDKK